MKSSKPYAAPTDEREMVEYAGLEGKNNGDATKWTDDLSDDNDILKRAKNMSAMAFLMYQFTKGSGSLRTTQDLFTQAEYFAEEANRLYKVLRHFSYQVCELGMTEIVEIIGMPNIYCYSYRVPL